MDSDHGKHFFGGISWETMEEKLSDYFGKYGDVLQTVVMRDKITGNPRGFGFVVFADPTIASTRVLEVVGASDLDLCNRHNSHYLYNNERWVVIILLEIALRGAENLQVGGLVSSEFASTLKEFCSIILLLEIVELSFVMKKERHVLNKEVPEFYKNAELKNEGTLIKNDIWNFEV
ncbi:Heterogeneous nuclear ribonucleoprotein 1 [Platanthera guangdongensis]|uniref:Heterogeneous nuclear ribonucleoprotein 1 n=1 Tax=Platanthera guangdongensis TaxID=2320717 RepID=A0ABR2LMQ7_9ASPA